jgi:hypothetical protein
LCADHYELHTNHLALISTIINGGDVVFDSSNQFIPQCVAVVTSDDDIVEDSGSFTLQLTLGVQNERVFIQPKNSSVSVEDNDSKRGREERGRREGSFQCEHLFCVSKAFPL